MSEAVDLWEWPQAEEIFMIAGWKQWADAGSISSGLPQYLVQQTNAHQIGKIRPDGFYLFQIPGTHELVRPTIEFEKGYPKSLESRDNVLYYTGDEKRGIVFFMGEEPHLDADRYVGAILNAAELLNVKRIITFGGVYGELPYDKERMVSAIYSLPYMEQEVESFGVNVSDYHGGASIGSYLCKRAGERNMESIGFYAFVPTYDFSRVSEISNTIRLENDFVAWLGVMRRVNYMLKLNLDLGDLEKRSEKLIKLVGDKVEELDSLAPQIGIREYMNRLSESFEETPFYPLDEVWENELRRLFDDD
ncbi:MAG: PAC2 family protein [Candidatus Promineifilaceae bacterium]